MNISGVHRENRAELVNAYNSLTASYGTQTIDVGMVRISSLEGAGISDFELRVPVSKHRHIFVQATLLDAPYSEVDIRALASQLQVAVGEVEEAAASIDRAIARVESELQRTRKREQVTAPFEVLSVEAIQRVASHRIDPEYVVHLRTWTDYLDRTVVRMDASSARDARIKYVDFAASNAQLAHNAQRLESANADALVDAYTVNLLEKLKLDPTEAIERLVSGRLERLILQSDMGPITLLLRAGLIVCKANVAPGVSYFNKTLFFEYVPEWAEEIHEGEDLTAFNPIDLLGENLIAERIVHNADSIEIDLDGHTQTFQFIRGR